MNAGLDVRIRVRGLLSSRLAAAFDGLTPLRRGGATELIGAVADQAQLHGLLTRVRDLGLDLESVTVAAADPAANAGEAHGDVEQVVRTSQNGKSGQ